MTSTSATNHLAGLMPCARVPTVSVATSREVRSAALQMPQDERAALALELLQSLEDPNDVTQPDVDAAWDIEIDRRVRGVESGEVVGVDADEAIRRVRASLKR